MSIVPARSSRVLGAIRAPWSPLAAAILALLLLGPCLAFTAEPSRAQQPGTAQGFLPYPDTNGREVVFSSEGDLWVAPLSGGIARRLTADEGEESLAHFSPDGARIAFSGQHGGNTDVFVIPAEGGPPNRLTYHPALVDGGGVTQPEWPAWGFDRTWLIGQSPIRRHIRSRRRRPRRIRGHRGALWHHRVGDSR